MRYIGFKMDQEGVNINDSREVLRWVIHNPLPTIEVMESDAAQQVIDERTARSAKHRVSLARLEAEEEAAR